MYLLRNIDKNIIFLSLFPTAVLIEATKVYGINHLAYSCHCTLAIGENAMPIIAVNILGGSGILICGFPFSYTRKHLFICLFIRSIN
jgi:hypothetical protein